MLESPILQVPPRSDGASDSPTMSSVAETRPKVLILGHSHGWCLSSGLRFLDTTASRYDFIVGLLGSKSLPGGFALRDGSGQERLNPILEHLLDQHISQFPSAELVVLSAYGGNHGNWLGLLRNRRSFDFVHPEQPDLPVTPDLPFLPYAAVRANFDEATEKLRKLFNLLKQFPGVSRVAHIEGPPPVPDATFIAKAIQATSESPEPAEINPAPLRLKLWLCQRDSVRAVCSDTGTAYVAPPPEAFNGEGYLRQEYWRDSVHGNARYGALMLRHVGDVLARATSDSPE